MSSKPLVIGNWKMNLDYVEAVHLSQQFAVMLKNKPMENVGIVVAPPFVDIRSVTSIIDSERITMEVAAQHVNANDNGAHTGEISAPMLKRLNVKWVLVGHSERRSMYAQRDSVVEQTLQAVVKSGMNAVLCVGEPLDVRESGDQENYVKEQIHGALVKIDPKHRELITLAYEPIWAIGTGLTASSEQVSEMTSFIRSTLKVLGLSESRILYGGSVNAENAEALINETGVDGFLVGGASLKAESFMAIIQACNDCYAGKR